MFEFISDHGNRKVGFDSSCITVNEVAFIPVNWETICGDIEEKIPKNLTQARGNPVQVSMFTDAAHAGDLITRWSQWSTIRPNQNQYVKKKHLYIYSICYHKVRESTRMLCAKGAARVAYEPTESKLADICTKIYHKQQKDLEHYLCGYSTFYQ